MLTGKITNRKLRGFSLVELLVVMAVLLILAAFTTPITLNTMDSYKLRGNLSSVSGLAQRCRVLALQQNTTSHLYFQTINGSVTVFCKANNAPTQSLQTADPQLTLDSKFSIGATPTNTLTDTTMWGTTGTSYQTNQDPYFNSRGLPCLAPSSGAACSSIYGYVYYLKYTSRTTRWTAMSVSPASRMQNWFWNGSSWGN